MNRRLSFFKKPWVLLGSFCLLGLLLILPDLLTRLFSNENRGNEGSPDSMEASEESSLREESLTIQKNDTLEDRIVGLGISYEESRQVIEALHPLFSPRHIRAGQQITALISPDNKLQKLTLTVSPINIFEVTPDGVIPDSNQFKASKLNVPVYSKIELIKVTLESSLYKALMEEGESPTLISELIDILSWDLDFFADPRKGDKISILVEKQYIKDQFFQYGPILAVNYNGALVRQKAFYFEPTGAYYDDEGNSLARNFLKSPVKYSRISSGFGRRSHPVTHKLHKHEGTDYVAPYGSPIWAMSDGRVIKKERNSTNGNYVAIRHNNGYITYYLHLSRFQNGLSVGQRVRQKDVIGYLGSTGRSTGPHLHLAVKYGGSYINPLTLKRVKSEALPENSKLQFNKLLLNRLNQMDAS